MKGASVTTIVLQAAKCGTRRTQHEYVKAAAELRLPRSPSPFALSPAGIGVLKADFEDLEFCQDQRDSQGTVGCDTALEDVAMPLSSELEGIAIVIGSDDEEEAQQRSGVPKRSSDNQDSDIDRPGQKPRLTVSMPSNHHLKQIRTAFAVEQRIREGLLGSTGGQPPAVEVSTNTAPYAVI